MKSADQDHFRIALRKNMAAAAASRKGAACVLSAAMCIHMLKKAMGIESARALEWRLEPDGFGVTKDGVPRYRNKVEKYEVGENVPNLAWREKAEKLVPGSTRLLNSPLWPVLDGKHRRRNNPAKRWLQQLPEDIRTILGPEASDMPQRAAQASFQEALKRGAGLEVLTAQTALIDAALETGQSAVAFSLSESVFRVLLINCTFEPYASFATELFSLFRRRVFERVTGPEYKWQVDDYDFEEMVLWLLALIEQMKNQGQISNRRGARTSGAVKLLDGQRGLDVMWAFAPPLVPAAPLSNTSSDLYQRCQRSNVLRNWGLGVIMENRVEHHPLPDVFTNPKFKHRPHLDSDGEVRYG